MAIRQLTSVKDTFGLVDDLSEKIKKSTCDSMIGTFMAPFRFACQTILKITLAVSFGVKLASQIAIDSLKMAQLVVSNEVQNPARSNYRVCFICQRLYPGNLHSSLMELDANHGPRVVF